MAPTTKYHGRATAVFWKETGGSFVDLSGSSRQFATTQAGQSIDVSTRDDKNADTRQKLVDTPERGATLGGLDTTPHASRVWHDIEIGETGTLLWYPLGTSGTGKPYEYADATVTKSDYASPYDNAATWDLAWEFNSAKGQGTN